MNLWYKMEETYRAYDRNEGLTSALGQGGLLVAKNITNNVDYWEKPLQYKEIVENE